MEPRTRWTCGENVNGSPVRSVLVGEGFSVFHAWYPARSWIDEHAFSGVTLSIPFAGGFAEEAGGKAVQVEPMQVLYNPADHLHVDRVEEEALDGVVIQLGARRAEQLREGLGGSRARGFDLGPRCLEGPRVQGLARSFRLAWESEVPSRMLSVEAVILQLLALLGEPRRVRGERPEWVGRIVEVLHDRFPRKPRLSELADLAGVHPVHMAQAFKRHMGQSIGSYVEELRVQAICDALEAGRGPMAEIALDTGFSDQSHMSRVFRRAMGVSPARYRQMRSGRTSYHPADP